MATCHVTYLDDIFVSSQSILGLSRRGSGHYPLGAAIFNPFGSAYLEDTVTQLGFVFPNTYSTITEISSVTVTQMFSQMTGSIEMGFVHFGTWDLDNCHPVIGLAFAPVVLFGF